MNNGFNPSLGQTFGLAANCLSQYQTSVSAGNNAVTGNNSSTAAHHGLGAGQLLYGAPQQQTSVTSSGQQPSPPGSNQPSNQPQSSANSMRMALQQFTSGQFVSFAAQPTSAVTNSSGNSSSYLKNVSCLQKEIESLKKQNLELQTELEKLRQAYTECNYQVMADSVKLTNYYEQVQRLEKDKLEHEKAYKDLKLKFENEKYQQQRNEERSLFCNECNFEVKSQVALFIHKLNHYFEHSIPRHLQLSTRSFTTMPDANQHEQQQSQQQNFKYKCHCCEIDPTRQYAKHEIYMHIYQFHTFDMPFKCKFCFLYFTSKSYLNDHLVEKHSVPQHQTQQTNQTNRQQQRNGATGRGRGSRTNQHLQQLASHQHQAMQHQNNLMINDPFGTGSGGQISGQYLSADPGSAGANPEMQYQHANLNSTLSLTARTQPLPQSGYGYHHHQHGHNQHNKRPRTLDYGPGGSGSQQPDINELFQQLVGETLDVNQEHLSGGVAAGSGGAGPPQHASQSSSGPGSGSSQQLLAQQTTTSKTFETMKRDAEIQQIMNDLDSDDSLNCKYPGCKFVATTKNHLRFHISAHLMSKYKCPYCTFVGNRIVEIKRHILKSTKHTDQHVFLCPGCDFASDCEKTFRDHYTRYHNSQADVTAVIERMFLNESNKVGQNIISAFAAAANASGQASGQQSTNSNNQNNSSNQQTNNTTNANGQSSTASATSTTSSSSSLASVTTTITKST